MPRPVDLIFEREQLENRLSDLKNQKSSLAKSETYSDEQFNALTSEISTLEGSLRDRFGHVTKDAEAQKQEQKNELIKLDQEQKKDETGGEYLNRLMDVDLLGDALEELPTTPNAKAESSVESVSDAKKTSGSPKNAFDVAFEKSKQNEEDELRRFVDEDVDETTNRDRFESDDVYGQLLTDDDDDDEAAASLLPPILPPMLHADRPEAIHSKSTAARSHFDIEPDTPNKCKEMLDIIDVNEIIADEPSSWNKFCKKFINTFA